MNAQCVRHAVPALSDYAQKIAMHTAGIRLFNSAGERFAAQINGVVEPQPLPV